MIQHSALIERLRGLETTSGKLFKIVGGAAQAAALMKGSVPLGIGPEAYVIPMGDMVGQPHGEYGTAQSIAARFGIALMVRIAGDSSGVTGLEKIEDLQRDLRAGLLGWQPGAAYSPCVLAGGRLLDFQPQALWWLEEFVSSYGVEANEDD